MELDTRVNLVNMNPDTEVTLPGMSPKQVAFFVNLCHQNAWETIDIACEAVRTDPKFGIRAASVTPVQAFRYLTSEINRNRQDRQDYIAASQRDRLPSVRQREMLKVWYSNIVNSGVQPDVTLAKVHALLSDMNASMFTFSRGLDILRDNWDQFAPTDEQLSFRNTESLVPEDEAPF